MLCTQLITMLMTGFVGVVVMVAVSSTFITSFIIAIYITTVRIALLVTTLITPTTVVTSSVYVVSLSLC